MASLVANYGSESDSEDESPVEYVFRFYSEYVVAHQYCVYLWCTKQLYAASCLQNKRGRVLVYV